jgi:hypothetical protein
MGCDTQGACITCKKSYDLGYGSYGKFEERTKSMPEEHKDHKVEFFSDDWTLTCDGNLMITGGGFIDDMLLVENFKDFEKLGIEYP